MIDGELTERIFEYTANARAELLYVREDDLAKIFTTALKKFEAAIDKQIMLIDPPECDRQASTDQSRHAVYNNVYMHIASVRDKLEHQGEDELAAIFTEALDKFAAATGLEMKRFRKNSPEARALIARVGDGEVTAIPGFEPYARQ